MGFSICDYGSCWGLVVFVSRQLLIKAVSPVKGTFSHWLAHMQQASVKVKEFTELPQQI